MFRDQFEIPLASDGSPAHYFCGNSLGLMPKRTTQMVMETLEDWKALGVEGHLHARHPWLPYHEFVTEPLAAVVGAHPEEVVAMNSLTVNLHLMMASFYRPTAKRFKILIEENAFPSDIYAAKSQLAFHGYTPEMGLIVAKARAGEDTLRTEDILALLHERGEEIGLVLMGGVNYYTGQLFDIQTITASAHERGCAVGWDLAHAAGNIHLKLHDWAPDFAAWCSYKYLNAGPGATAGVFIHTRHLGRKDIPRFEGWWGHDKATRFRMGSDFQPIPTAEAWQLSNPAILPLAALRASLQIFTEAGGMAPLRQRSLELTGRLESKLLELPAGKIQMFTPQDPAQRGCQLSLRVLGGNGRAAFDALTVGNHFIADWREPDCIRVAPTPLYNTEADVDALAKRLGELL